MPTIRVCSCNGEWMNDWFTPDADVAAFKPTFTRDGHTSNTAATAGRLAAELAAIDADLVALQEFLLTSSPGLVGSWHLCSQK